MHVLTAMFDRFDFRVEPIFYAYEESAVFHAYPTIENITDVYDLNVTDRLDNARLSLPSLSVVPRRKLLDHVRYMDANERMSIDDSIGMKAAIEMKDVLKVCRTFNMMYMDDTGARNYPVKGVW